MLHLSMRAKDNTGFFIRPSRDLINRLRQLATEFKKPSANQVAVEVIIEYLDSWVEIETIRRAARDAQDQRVAELKEQMLRGPLLEAKTESGAKTSVRRKRG